MTNFEFCFFNNSCNNVSFWINQTSKLAICSGKKWIVPLHTIYYSWFLPEQNQDWLCWIFQLNGFQLIEVHCKIEGCILPPLRNEESKHCCGYWNPILPSNIRNFIKYKKFYRQRSQRYGQHITMLYFSIFITASFAGWKKDISAL